MLRQVVAASLLLLGAGLLAGCGQKGALFLPPSKPVAPVPASSTQQPLPASSVPAPAASATLPAASRSS